MRRLALLLLPLLLFVAGCGGGRPSSPSPSQPAATTPAPVVTCAPAVPARMGACVAQRFGVSQRPTAQYGARGVDVSVYQGYPCWGCAKAAGLRLVYNQTGDGAYYRDANFTANWVRERQLGIAHGAYLFLRPGSGVVQADALANSILAVGGMDRTALPPVLDAEVPGAYQVVCSAAARLRARLHTAVVVYTSPGLWWGGPACGTLLWPAEWGTGGYSFSGWGGYMLQQYSGAGYFPGVSGQVDLDVDHGILGLLPHPKPPAPSPSQLRRDLYRDYGYRTALRGLLARHQCRPPLHARPRSYHSVCGTWLREGAAVNASIRGLHARHIY